MTIEIKQLVVRAVVEPRREGVPPAAASGPRARIPPEPATRRAPPGRPGADLEPLVAECVRRVLRELQKRQGR